jgi:isoquinoline 1-oxidoreductase
VAANELDEGGLDIVGTVMVGMPAASGGYSTVAYGNTQPGDEATRWIAIKADGAVVAYAGKVEYGQGVRSGFAIEVADELRLSPEDVQVVLGDTDEVPWDMGTFGSQSTGIVGVRLRKAAATARQVLLELASERLDLPTSELVCQNGGIGSKSDPKRSFAYGDLVSGKDRREEIDDDAVLTRPKDFTAMGRTTQRTDAIERVTGTAVYAQDVMLPEMLFGQILRPPTFNARLAAADVSVAEKMPGVVQVVRDGDTIAVLAETDEQADQAAMTIQASWDAEREQTSHLDMPDLLTSTGRNAMIVQEAGSLIDGFKEADEILEAVYYVPYVTNAPMEPRAAVAEWTDGRLTVWAGTQRPFGLRVELAQHFGIEETAVRVIAPEIGGGFGAKSYYPVAVEAAQLAKEAGRPVRLAYTRAEDTVWGSFRPAALIRIKSGFRSDGSITAWRYEAYHAGERALIGRRGSETPYDIPAVSVKVSSSDSPLRVGSYRSLGGAVNHFARESHIDEIAATIGADPVELRLRNLKHPRYRRVLEQAADRFGWQSKELPLRTGAGVAIGADVGSYVATCLEVEVQGKEVKVNRVTTALDCGLTVNPDGAVNQVEGAVIMGMGTALYEAIEFRRGSVLNPGFARYRVPRINDAPSIEVLLAGDPDEPSTGAGEPGIVPVAAAIGNAIFDGIGERLRELPFQPHLP